MNKSEYIEALRKEIQALPEAERNEALKYYSDYFDDAGPENESQVIDELGSPEDLAKFILRNFSCVPEKIPVEKRSGETASKNKNGTAEKSVVETTDDGSAKAAKILLLVLLAVITFPIWASIFTAVGGVLFGLFVAVIVVGFVLVLAALVILLGGIFLAAFGIGMLFGAPLSGLLLIGTGLLLAGAGLICVMGGAWVCGKIVPAIIRGIVSLCRIPFKRKEATA